ncbi:hypothetical protein ACFLZH_05085 [Patescibacteria group bacterium]
MPEKPEQQLEEGSILSRETLDLLTLEEEGLHGSHGGMVGDETLRERNRRLLREEEELTQMVINFHAQCNAPLARMLGWRDSTED